MDKVMSAALMKDFGAEQIGHKPATWCKACSDTVRSRQGKSCAQHKVIRCANCKTQITEAHICLDFVGHADVRARLCEVDPEWTWAPFEFPGVGSLVLNDGQPVGLWIHLTIGGVTKPGYGSCETRKPEAMKELIGDAIRNAGLSFGIAWKLWAKGERTGSGDGDSDSASGQAQGTASPGAQSDGNGRPANGQAVRPAQAARQAPEASGEPDPEAQPFADEASQALTVEVLKRVHTRAREAHKLAALIRNPASDGVGGLGQYLNWRKTVLERADRALAALTEAGKTAGLDDAELEHRVVAACGKGINDAGTEDLEKAAALILKGAGVAA